jgi:WD40 repeat protein
MFYSPDGQHLVAGGEDGYVRVWNAQTGELDLTLSGSAGKNWPLSINKDGTRLFTVSGYNIMEWDISTDHEILTLSGRIGSLPFSPDGKQLALIGNDNSISILDSQTGEAIVHSWQAHSDWIEDAAWSPDGKQLVTISGDFNYSRMDNSARVWDTATGQLLKDLPIDWGYHLAAWSPDGRRLVASNFYSSTTFIWDSSTWNLLDTRMAEIAFTLAYSPDGKKLPPPPWVALRWTMQSAVARYLRTRPIELPCHWYSAQMVSTWQLA